MVDRVKAERTFLCRKIGLLRNTIQKSQNLSEDLYMTNNPLVKNKKKSTKINTENVSRSALYLTIILKLREKADCSTSLQL